jgi:hypothetical protein
VSADAQTIRFTYDSDADGLCDSADEDITYNFVPGCSSGMGNITREDAANPGPVQLTDCNVPVGTAKFSFTYFPKDCDKNFSTPVGGGAATCPAAAGGNAGTLAGVQRVSISLTVQSEDAVTEFGGGQLKATMISNVDLRNIGLPP